MKRNRREYSQLLTRVRRLVEVMPLFKLQRVGNTTLPFLYTAKSSHVIELQPGIMFCLRKFYPFITRIVRDAWISYVRRNNSILLGDPTQLDDFLFGAERARFVAIAPILRDVQEERCLYCGRKTLVGTEHLDHFIPWSRYPVELGHNFVLAHARCNAAKAQHIAAARHLEKWRSRNCDAADELDQRFAQQDIPHDLGISDSVASWAYAQVKASSGLTWISGRTFVPLPSGWSYRTAVGPK